MMSNPADPAVDLALQVRTEVSDRLPEGFHFSDHLIRHDEALEHAPRRAWNPDRSEVERALGRAIADESDGWTLLKLPKK